MSEDDGGFARAGIRVDASALTASKAEDFMTQVQGAWLRRIHEAGSYFSIVRIELRNHPAGASAHVFGGAGQEIRSHVGSTPRELADAVYEGMGGTNPPAA